MIYGKCKIIAHPRHIVTRRTAGSFLLVYTVIFLGKLFGMLAEEAVQTTYKLLHLHFFV